MFDMLCAPLTFNVSSKRLYYSTRNRFQIITKMFSLLNYSNHFLINGGLDNRFGFAEFICIIYNLFLYVLKLNE